MNFEQAWKTTSLIGGFFEREEAELYWKILNTLPKFGIVVEVGVENGRSTSLPAQFSVSVSPLVLHCVDNFSTFGKDGQERFWKNMKAIGAPYLLWNLSSSMAAAVSKINDIDCILIDADHSDCDNDCDVWLPRLKRGGWALFHDYGRQPWDIEEVVNRRCYEWKGETVGSLAARRKP